MNSIVITFVCNKGFLDECDKKEKMEVPGGVTASCWQRRLKRFVQCHVFAHSPPGRRPNDKYPVSNLIFVVPCIMPL